MKAVVSGDRDAELRWKQAAPEQISIGYNIPDPTKVDLALMRREHAAGRLQVIGEVGGQYAGIPPNDPRMEPLFALAEELDVPIALHMHPGPPGAPYPPFSMTKMRAGNGHPLLLEDVLVRHPKLRLYVMHAGWPFLDEMKALLYEHPQVYVDVGVIGWLPPRPEFHRFLRGLVEAGFGKRIMFGSDQMAWPDRIEKTVEAIEQADSSPLNRKTTSSTTTPLASCAWRRNNQKTQIADNARGKPFFAGVPKVCHSLRDDTRQYEPFQYPRVRASVRAWLWASG